MDNLLLASITFLISVFCIIAGFIIKLWLDERNSGSSKESITFADGQGRKKATKVKNNLEEPIHDHTAEDEEKRYSDENKESKKSPRWESTGTNKQKQNFKGQDEEEAAPNTPSDKKLGKKKLAKLQAKAEAKVEREQQQTEREEKKRREQEIASQMEEKRLLEEKDEQKRKKKLELEREEKEKRETEEYLKLKESFNVREHGFDNENEDIESENFINNFLDYIRKKKVVHIDELASHYRIKSEGIVDRLNTFLQERRINGVFDDRGLFTYISDKELLDVAKFINQRGRVNLSELTENSNRMITHTPVD